MLFIVDADALVVLADSLHKNHTRGKAIFGKILEHKVLCIYPISALCEAVTVLQKTLKKPEAANFLIALVEEGLLCIEDIDREILLEAMKLFHPFDKPGDTLFDSIIATIAIRRKADAIFSFDNGYRRRGLHLAEDVFSDR